MFTKKMKTLYLILLMVLLIGGCGGDSSGGSSSFDISSNAPVIESVSTDNNNYSVEQNATDIVAYVKENTRNAFKVNATDRSTLYYSLAGDDFSLFSIDGLSGEIAFIEPTDYEKKSTYKFTVVITDSVGNQTTKNVKIYVRDIKNEVAHLVVVHSDKPLSGIDESEYFITTWKTHNKGASQRNQISIPTMGDGYDYSVDWGDGTSSKNVTADITHTYKSIGTYRVKIAGDFPRIAFSKNSEWDGDRVTYLNDNQKILSIQQWGKIHWISMVGAFGGCSKLKGEARDKPILSNLSSLSSMFYEATSFNQDIGNWDVSPVKDMHTVFYGATSFNQDIGGWDVSHVIDMSFMFYKATNFNQDIGAWDVSKVTDISFMFDKATNFNSDIGEWDIGNVTNMSGIFIEATNFNQDIGNWNLSNVQNIYAMFYKAIHFNQDIGRWDTSKVTNMGSMFLEAQRFNQDIGNWDTSNVTNLSFMFGRAGAFNQDIGAWNVSKVTDMRYLFAEAISFNQNLERWNVANATTVKDKGETVSAMEDMFYNTSSLEQKPSWYHETSTSNTGANPYFLFLKREQTI